MYGKDSTFLSLFCIFFVLVVDREFKSFVACSSLSFAFSSIFEKLSNSFFTSPNTFQTLLECFSMDIVLNAKFKLFNNAYSVVGPVIIILYSLCMNSIKCTLLDISEYRLSIGRNNIAKSVVLFISIYFSLISFENFLIDVSIILKILKSLLYLKFHMRLIN